MAAAGVHISKFDVQSSMFKAFLGLRGSQWERHLAANNVAAWCCYRGKMLLPQRL
jgi:hypothetical protein